LHEFSEHDIGQEENWYRGKPGNAAASTTVAIGGRKSKSKNNIDPSRWAREETRYKGALFNLEPGGKERRRKKRDPFKRRQRSRKEVNFDLHTVRKY